MKDEIFLNQDHVRMSTLIISICKIENVALLTNTFNLRISKQIRCYQTDPKSVTYT